MKWPISNIIHRRYGWYASMCWNVQIFPFCSNEREKKLLKIFFFSFWKIRYYVEEIFTSQPNIVALSKFQVCKRRITDNTHPTDIKPKNEWLLQKFGNVFITALDKTNSGICNVRPFKFASHRTQLTTFGQSFIQSIKYTHTQMHTYVNMLQTIFRSIQSWYISYICMYYAIHIPADNNKLSYLVQGLTSSSINWMRMFKCLLSWTR